MSEKFEVGEIAIACNLVSYPEFNGAEVTVISSLQFGFLRSERSGRIYGPLWFYDVQWADGTVTGQTPNELRKKRPPKRKREQLGEWELCPWRPATASVTERI